MGLFKTLFSKRPALIGMIHVRPLPGTPAFVSFEQVLQKAQEEAEILSKFSLDGLIVENMHDTPYVKAKDLGPEVTACMATICSQVRGIFPAQKPVGVQILAGANLQAMAVAKAAGLQFIRAENFIFSHVADEGLMPDASAGPLLRYRRMIDAQGIAVFADIKVWSKRCSTSSSSWLFTLQTKPFKMCSF